MTGADRIEVINASEEGRLVRESLEAGELLPAGEGRYCSRSHIKDTARSGERTVVATSNAADKGVYNNWRPASELAVRHPPVDLRRTTSPVPGARAAFGWRFRTDRRAPAETRTWRPGDLAFRG